MPRAQPPDPGLAAAIRERRHELGVSQEDIAHSAGLTVAAYARIETAKANPTWRTVQGIAGALDVRPSELAERAERTERG